jgi:hypothetical protein
MSVEESDKLPELIFNMCISGEPKEEILENLITVFINTIDFQEDYKTPELRLRALDLLYTAIDLISK